KPTTKLWFNKRSVEWIRNWLCVNAVLFGAWCHLRSCSSANDGGVERFSVGRPVAGWASTPRLKSRGQFFSFGRRRKSVWMGPFSFTRDPKNKLPLFRICLELFSCREVSPLLARLFLVRLGYRRAGPSF